MCGTGDRRATISQEFRTSATTHRPGSRSTDVLFLLHHFGGGAHQRSPSEHSGFFATKSPRSDGLPVALRVADHGATRECVAGSAAISAFPIRNLFRSGFVARVCWYLRSDCVPDEPARAGDRRAHGYGRKAVGHCQARTLPEFGDRSGGSWRWHLSPIRHGVHPGKSGAGIADFTSSDFVVVLPLLLAAALFASHIPVWRAAKADPLVALWYE